MNPSHHQDAFVCHEHGYPSREVIRPEGLASDTLVRTTTGIKRVGDVQVGDYLYDADNRPALCISAAPPATANLKKIMYTQFDSRTKSSFTCTPNYRLSLTTVGTRALTSRSKDYHTVHWHTRCDRKYTMNEAGSLYLDILSDYLYQDLAHAGNDPEPATIHAYIETILDHYHPGQEDKYSKCIDEYLERVNTPVQMRGVREAINTSLNSYLELLSARRAETEEVDSTDEVFGEVESISDVFDIDKQISGKFFVELDLPSSQSSQYVPSSQAFSSDGAPRSSSPSSDTSSMTEKQAQLVLKLLQSDDHHHLVDPLIIRDGEKFCMTVAEYERLCCNSVKRHHLKLYRVGLAFDPATVSADSRALPVDPYFLGLWLGDGTAREATITSVDPEIPAWLQGYVNRLNCSRTPGAPELHLSKQLSQAAGTNRGTNRRPIVATNDVFKYRIAGSQRGSSYGRNRVYNGLRELGLLRDKSGGIPAEYMTAGEEARLALIAGLIDSDGTYVKSRSEYRLAQETESHRKIVYDLKELALSCGISATGVYIHNREALNGAPDPSVNYSVVLGKGSEKFQKYVLIPRKRMNLVTTYYTHDARPLTVSNTLPGEYRAIEVSGGQFQLANRLVVYDCHLNSRHVSTATHDHSAEVPGYSVDE
ncbi:hypothetical protein V1527DRAFT_491754 [Lipomyces starkeyi]